MKPSRRFELWIARSGLSRTAVADKLMVCRSVITYWCGGSRRPNPKSAQAIQFLTKGEVPAESWGYAVDALRPGPRKLQRFLLKNALTSRALALDLGVATTTARSWVKGLSAPNEENCRRLSTLMNVKLSPKDF